jgi:starch synthase
LDALKILIVSAEIMPFAKTGGLADVSGALAVALARLGHDTRTVMPRYAAVDPAAYNLLPILGDIQVRIGTGHWGCEVRRTTFPRTSIPAYFIECPALFNRPGLYGEDGKDYPDNPLRFGVFCTAVAWLLKGLDWTPDVILCNDWQTALLPVYLRNRPDMMVDPMLARIKVAYVIHNLAYQGVYPLEVAPILGLGPDLVHPAGLEFHGRLNLMKGGIIYSDRIVTVSPRYAREILTPEFGCGLDGLLRIHKSRVSGILNGIDTDVWNPESDGFIPVRYGSENLQGKARCKALLLKELELTAQPELPLAAIISRLDPQKGLDLAAPVVETLVRHRHMNFVLLGTGHEAIRQMYERIAQRYPGRVACKFAMDNALAHKIEAGSDLFLMPSRFEPCGLSQLYSMRYGTPPVVRAVGGLADSVIDCTPETLENGTATGFVFEDYSTEAFLGAIQRALQLYQDKPSWNRLQLLGMARNSSWDASARSYADLFETMIGQIA